MSSVWSYAPVTIHLDRHQFHQQPSHSTALSGAYLINTYTRNYYFISINDIQSPEKYNYKFTNREFISSTTVRWIPLTLTHHRSLKIESKQHSALMSFLQGLTHKDQFKFKPHDLEYLSVLVLRLSANFKLNNQALFDRKALTPLQFMDSNEVDIPTKIDIRCCPFSLTNAAIFADYQMSGSVNYRIGASGYLSDVKYLDDIIGGMVNIQDYDDAVVKSLGLVCGSLSKVNGDGDLMVIISWNKIFEVLSYPDLGLIKSIQISDTSYPSPPQSIDSNKTSDEIIKPYDPIDSVVRISIRSNNGSFWGSGVIYSNTYIITNLHVLKLETLEDLRISIPNLPHIHIGLNDVIPIRSPLIGFDLCFLKLKNPNFLIIPATISNSFQDPLYSGRVVKSVGHGLFHTEDVKLLRPFHSEGTINSIISLNLDDEGYNMPSMLLVSASCWNGSSGGGLFNEKNELIGMMTSNGKLSSGEILPRFTLAIPVNIIEKCLFMIENGLNYVDVEEQVQNVWSLRNTHKNVNVNSISHKL